MGVQESSKVIRAITQKIWTGTEARLERYLTQLRQSRLRRYSLFYVERPTTLTSGAPCMASATSRPGQSVFEGMTYTFEDDRFSYGEQRFVTLGLLAGINVSVVHMENEHEIRIISFRKATKRESQIYFDAIQN